MPIRAFGCITAPYGMRSSKRRLSAMHTSSFEAGTNGFISRANWFTGLTWKGLALIVLLCMLNAARRTIQHSIGVVPLDEWLLNFAEVSGTGLIVALPIALAVVATYNRVSTRPWLRYPALALALILSSMTGVAILTALESDGTFEFSK